MRCLVFTDGACGIWKILHASHSNHDAFRDGLFRRRKQALVEADSVRAGHLIETVGHFRGVEAATQHLRSKQSHAAADWTSSKHFLDQISVVIDGDVKVLAVKRNLSRGSAELTRTLDADRGNGRHLHRL